MRRELAAAGIVDPPLRASYELCRRLNARHGRTYYLATLLLPAGKRPYVHALYGFARYADDLVDELDDTLADAPLDDTVRAERFRLWAKRFRTDLDAGQSTDPVGRALVDTLSRWEIPATYVQAFLESMAMDLTVTGYETYADLDRYMWGSAAVIGLQMLPILGRADPHRPWADLEPYAIDLGHAFQMTNFIRDVGEDLERGRVYLPRESLQRFGVERDALAQRRSTPAIRRLLAYETERTRALYRRAAAGIELVAPSSRPCLRTAFTLYGGILDEIERAGYDVFAARRAVPGRRRLRVAGAGLVSAWAARRSADPATPTGST
jgi:phytoene synthase